MPIALHPFQRIIRYGDFEMGIKIDNTNMYRSPSERFNIPCFNAFSINGWLVSDGMRTVVSDFSCHTT
ncbi:hypothetical protein [Lysinibacillus capsici]|uniref:hypothetical protein n=1 Tax=Lysinibacillus capsici TaxID=2115968 RepID=UPI002FDD1582